MKFSPDFSYEAVAHFMAQRWKAQQINTTSWPEEGGNPPMTKGRKVEENLLSNRGKPYWTVLGWCGRRPGEMQNIQLEKVVTEVKLQAPGNC